MTNRPASHDAADRVLEPERLVALGVDLDDEELVVDLVRTFLEELPARLAAAVAGGEEGRRALHSLSSTASMLGARELGIRAAAAERGRGSLHEVHRTAPAAALALRRWLACRALDGSGRAGLPADPDSGLNLP